MPIFRFFLQTIFSGAAAIATGFGGARTVAEAGSFQVIKPSWVLDCEGLSPGSALNTAFVVMILQEYFKRDLETATQIMLKIHHEGRGVCGVYSKDVAATKVELVLAAARRGGHPLQCIMEAA